MYSASITPRAITGPTKDYKCDDGTNKTTFTASYITRVITQAAKDKADKDATARAIEILNTLPECTVSKTTQRNNDFCQPKDFKNHPDSHTGLHLHFPDCPHGPWLEFPLLTDGKIYSGNKPPGRENPARVVFQYTSKNTAKFCGAVTHSTATSKGQFVSCAS
ncbi:hypothetical protein O181_000866 [Austropuccinia psidii MF-1]|uniref:Uncharacterized protein n=1 Tax=Austropuccinia psidii MF-1 TaxID=1389203 RepID=A0A9Q3B9W1_9BASI|nr:hypothetical protein [Austropuccinia psidii MF-1]